MSACFGRETSDIEIVHRSVGVDAEYLGGQSRWRHREGAVLFAAAFAMCSRRAGLPPRKVSTEHDHVIGAIRTTTNHIVTRTSSTAAAAAAAAARHGSHDDTKPTVAGAVAGAALKLDADIEASVTGRLSVDSLERIDEILSV